MCPQAKIVLQKKATGPMPLRCIFKEDICSFFVFSPYVRAKSVSKEVFMPPKQKSCPKRKQQDRRHGDAFCDKDLFFGLHLRIYFLPLSSPAHYSGAGSSSMNRSEIRLKIVFLKDHNITSISTVCLGLGEDLFLFCLEITAFPKLFSK